MSTTAVRDVSLPSGETIPVLGQGTWHLGLGRHAPEEEVAALRLGLDLGLTLVDTAEMYGDGASERLIGRAIRDRRNDVFLVTKVLPHHATHRGTINACRNSLMRLNTTHIDLYLLHWRGTIPLEETLAGFDDLKRAGATRHWGVSNFDLCHQRGIPVMAYSPLEQGRLLRHPVLRAVAERRGATPAQVALAWSIRHEGVTAIPEAGTREHVRENHGALSIELTSTELAALDGAFPPPSGPRPLEVR